MIARLLPKIVGLAITLLAGWGVGEVADKVAPDANLKLSLEGTPTTNTRGWLKTLAIFVVSGIVAGMILKRLGLTKYKLL